MQPVQVCIQCKWADTGWVDLDVGLRERKKLATRSALHQAALRLAVVRGVAHVTAEDISAEAGVSTRTFFNYFPTKEEAFVADDLDRGHRFVATVAAAPDGAPVWSMLRETAIAVFGASDLPKKEQALKEQLVRTSPDVVAHVLATFARLEQELVVELERRVPATSPLHARLLANAVVAAIRAAAETWLSSTDPAPSFPDLLDQAFRVLAPAFPADARTAPRRRSAQP
jgi:AcrR family transcriptional regulator